MNNTARSYALVGAKVPLNSTIAKKLREARAIILGETRPSQWGHLRSFNISKGWSARVDKLMDLIIPAEIPLVVQAVARWQRRK